MYSILLKSRRFKSPIKDAPGYKDAWVEAFVAYIQDAIGQNHIPGLALALVRRDETLRVQGFGLRNVAAKIPVTLDTLSHIGSTHKSMTALLIAALVDNGAMAWDKPVASITEKFALSNPQATAHVTIRHLLGMQGGIPASAEDVRTIENCLIWPPILPPTLPHAFRITNHESNRSPSCTSESQSPPAMR